MRLVAKRVSGQGVLELRHRRQIAGVHGLDRLDLLAEHQPNAGEPLAAVAIEVPQVVVVLENTRDDLEITDSAGKGVGDGLVYEQ